MEKRAMDRKQFMKRMFKASLCGCGAVMGLNQDLLTRKEIAKAQDQSTEGQKWIADLEKRMVKGSETPAWRRVEKSEIWIKDLMKNMDVLFDKETRIKLMKACGRSCYNNAFGVASEEKPTLEGARRYLQALKSRGYEVRQERDKTIIIFNWGRDHQNPQGLVLGDGYCMCPVVETGPDGLSPTFCYCSTGYVGEIFERAIGIPVEVDLLDSLKKGGKDCIFKIEFKSL